MQGEVPPPEIVEAFDAIVPLTMSTASVIMQLSRLPIGRAVAESPVQSGRIDRHPLKRFRTTLSYVLIAVHGTEPERRAMAVEVNRIHALVRSRPGDPVAYSAFDPELQLWVAACLYRGFEDAHRWLRGPLEGEALERCYRFGARVGTMLQVRPEMWPPTRHEFERYWQAQLEGIQMDEVSRAYLQGLARLDFLPAPARALLGPPSRLLTVGFLPPRFRAELGLAWGDREQRAFEAATGLLAAIDRRLPGPVRRFPLQLYLWDLRRRLRAGRPVL